MRKLETLITPSKLADHIGQRHAQDLVDASLAESCGASQRVVLNAPVVAAYRPENDALTKWIVLLVRGDYCALTIYRDCETGEIVTGADCVCYTLESAKLWIAHQNAEKEGFSERYPRAAS